MTNKKIELHFIGFLAIIMLMFVGAMKPLLTYTSIFLTAIVSVWMGQYYVKSQSDTCCIGIIMLLVLQNLMLGLGAHITQNTDGSIKFITQIPFLTIFFIWVPIFLRKSNDRDLQKSKYYFIVLLTMIVLAFLIGRGSIESILMNVRNLTVFFMAYEIGYHCIQNEKSFCIYQRKYLKITIFVLLMGVILLTGGYKLYRIIGIKEVYTAKGSPLLYEALDDRFHTTLISRQYDRMGSIYYEPVNLAYFFAIAFLMAWFGNWTYNKNKKFLMIIITGLGLLLTFGKGGYLIVGAIFLCVYGEKILRLLKLPRKTVVKLTVVGVLLVLIAFCIYYYNNIGAAASQHFWGVIRTWWSVLKRPYGYGLGTGGNMASIFNSASQSWLDSGGETALMSYLYQLGIQGGVAFSLCVMSLSLGKTTSNKTYAMFRYIPFVLLGISLLQDNTFSPQCIVPFMLMQGGARRINAN